MLGRFVVRTFNIYKVSFFAALLFGGVALLNSTASQAGFEWIPAEPSAQAEPKSFPTVPPATIENPEPVQEQMPAETLLQAPQEEELLSPLPPLESPAPVQVERKPLSMPPAMSAEQPVELAAPQPVAAPPQEPVLKVKKMQAMPERSAPESIASPSLTQQDMVNPQDVPVDAAAAAVSDPMPEEIPAEPAPAQTIKIEANPVAAPVLAAAPEPLEVVGFGNDIPLALALQEIAPPGYAFSFGDGINPGERVSWTGGKDWTVVMEEMIAPLGLRSKITGKAILVYREQSAASAVEPYAGENQTTAPVAAAPQEAQGKLVVHMSEDMDFDAEKLSKSGGSESANVEVVTETQPKRVTIQDPGAEPQSQPAETLLSMSRTDEASSKPIVWEASKGASLKQTLESWSEENDLVLEWKAVHDFQINNDILVSGELNKAVKALIMGGIAQENAPNVVFYESTPDAPKGKIIVEDPAA